MSRMLLAGAGFVVLLSCAIYGLNEYRVVQREELRISQIKELPLLPFKRGAALTAEQKNNAVDLESPTSLMEFLARKVYSLDDPQL
uniref:hypothetical protein n=1 Tax=Pseudomonas asplenii TaxID=53407 RepID=UPI00056229CB